MKRKFAFRFCLFLAFMLFGALPVDAQDEAKKDILTGYVKDRNGQPLPGVNVVVKDITGTGVSTDMDGKFVIDLNEKRTLVFSFIGMKSKTISIKDLSKPLIVILEEDAVSLDGVVVNGYFTKTRESFTGSEVTITGEQLKEIGSNNLLSSLAVFNPSLRLTEELEYGSDPNHIPEMTLRGQSTFDLRGSAEGSRSNPNAPLYIMDGVEVSAETVYDYDINRIESTIILKDASATAIYGSRGANGVIVITTKRPTPGKIRVDFSANNSISIPDLRDYN